MFPLDMLGEPVWQRLTWTLLHFLWQGLAVAAVVATLLYVWPVRRAHNRYLIYLSALIAMAVCPLVTFMVIDVPESAMVASRETEMEVEVPLAPDPLPAPRPEFVATDIHIEPTSPAVLEDASPLEGSEAAPLVPAPSDVENSASLPVPVTPETKLRQYIDAIQPYALIAWIAGVLLLAVRLSMSWLHVRWLAWGRRVVPTDLADKAATLGERLGLRFPPRICVSEKIREAIVVGLWRPLVLLPASWLTEMTPEVLEAVIAHELAHVRRLDLWVNLLQRLMETLLFYHPAVWWLSRRVSVQREMCADELAVGATSKRLVYATALEQLGRMRLGQTAPQLGASIGGNKMVLLSRVGNILGLSASTKRARWWPVALLAMAVPLAIWLASMSIASPPQNEIQAEEVIDDTADTSTSEDVVDETEEEASWGEAAEGVQVRLRAAKSRWNEGTVARLWADVRNQGERNLFVCTQFNRCELEVDGRWYRGPFPGGVLMRPQPFPPGSRHQNIGADLHEAWELKGARMPRGTEREMLKLTGGKHTIRVAFTAPVAKNAPGKPVRAVSNPVVIEVISAEEIAARPERLKSQKNSLELRLAYHGPMENPKSGVENSLRSLILHTTSGDYRLLPGWSAVWMSEEQAARIIDHLQADGSLSDALPFTDDRPPPDLDGPAYSLTIKGPEKMELYKPIGWGLGVVDFLERLQTVLDGEVAQAVDQMMTVLGPQRKQWEAVAKWGRAVEGVQVRLRADKSTWTEGAEPQFSADVRNLGTRNLLVYRAGRFWTSSELEIDGRWYRRPLPEHNYRPPLSDLVPGRQFDKILVNLRRGWSAVDSPSQDAGETGVTLSDGQLKLAPGKHTIRVAPTMPLNGDRPGDHVRAISNPVEIEIVPVEPAAEAEETAWGEARDGLRIQAAVDKKAWRVGEGTPRASYGNVPLVRVEVSVSDAKQFQEGGLAEKRMSHAPSAFALEIDGRRYDNRTFYTAWPVPFMQPFKTVLALDETWIHNGQPRSHGEPLEWQPGKHTVRVLFTGLGQAPAPASQPLEIEILPAESKLGPWDHPWGEAVQGVQVSTQPVPAQWPLGSEPALRTRIRNTGDKQWTIHNRPYSFALEIDGKRYSDSHVYPTWKMPLEQGDEYEVTLKLNKMWREGERGQIGPFLPPLGPGKHTVRVTLTELGKSCRPASRPVEIEILGERVGQPDPLADAPGKRLVGQWLSDDRAKPEKYTFEAGGNYTLEKPGEGPQRGSWRSDGGRLVFQLAEKEHTHEFQWWGPDKIRVFSEDSSTRWHLLRIDPQSGKVIRWGEMISGVMARLDPERLRWPEGETPAFRLLLHQVSFGELLLSTVQMQESRLEVDGKLYRHPPEDITGVAYHRSMVWVKHISSGGPRVVLDGQWRSMEADKPPQLAPGKHTVRYGWAGYHQQQNDPTKVDKERPVLLWSSPVEIEIVAKSDEKADAKQLGNANATAAESTIEATAVEPDDRTTSVPPVSDPTLEGKKLLDKLKSLDAVYEADFTASGTRPGWPKRKWKFTMHRGRIALEEEVVEIPKPTETTKASHYGPTQKGRFIAMRSTFYVGPTAQGKYDWVGRIPRYGPLDPWPENSPGPATAGSLKVDDPDAPTYMLHIRRTLWCLGRGYSKHITKIRDVSRQEDGRLKVAADGLDMALRPGAKWELVIDPDAEYMVRSAELVDNGNRRSSFTNSGLKRHGSHCVPQKGECKGGFISASYEFQSASFEADAEFLKRAKATMSPPFLIHTDVSDQRKTPELLIQYDAGKLSPQGGKPDWDLDFEKPGKAITPGAKADLKIEARIVGVDGKSPERCSITFWKAVDHENVEKTVKNPVASRFSIPHVWHDSVTDKTWQPIHHFATKDSATSEELGPGDYRVTANLGHGNPTMVGVSEPIRLDGSREHTVVTLAMEAGPSLTIDVLDAKTGEPIEYAAVRLVRPDGLPVVSWSSGAWSVLLRENQHKFEHLAPGDYTLEVFKRAYQYGQNEYAAEQMPMNVRLAVNEDRRITVKLKAVGPSEEDARRRWPWSVTGTVTDQNGQPLEGVEIRASCGMGTLMPTGSTTSDEQGRYTLRFGPGMRSLNESTGTWNAGLQAATIYASKPGHTEKNLGRQGGLMMADELPPKDNAWGAKPSEIVLPRKPYNLDFVMVPSAAIEGEVVDEQGQPIADRRVSVHGKQGLPSTSVLAQGKTDKQGRFRFEGIPANYAWWFDIQDKGRTRPISLPGPGSYRVKMQTVHDARYNVNTVQITGVTNPKDAEVRDRVVGDDPSVRPPVSDELQQQGREYLRKMAAACSGWIGPPPSAIKNYEYRFQLGDQPPETIEVKEPSRAGRTTRQGIHYVGTPHVLAARPEKVVFRQVETVGETIQLRFLVQDAVKIAAGNGITGRFHGFFSSPLREGTLVLDKHTYRPLRTEIGDELRETFSQYASLGEGRSAPLRIQVERGSNHWDWRFRVYGSGLWLLAESRSGDQVMLTNDEVKVNGQPAIPMPQDGASAWGKPADDTQTDRTVDGDVAADVSMLQDIQTLADLRRCEELKVDDTPWRVRVGLGDGGADGVGGDVPPAHPIAIS